MRILNVQYIIDSGKGDAIDEAVIDAIRKQVKTQQEIQPDGVTVLMGDEIKNA
jgi:hypothetical protein